MFQTTPYRKKALEESQNQSVNWQSIANESYIREAGWYFKTLAVQEVGEYWKDLFHLSKAGLFCVCPWSVLDPFWSVKDKTKESDLYHIIDSF